MDKVYELFNVKKEKQTGEVTGGGFATGEENIEIATKNAVNNLKRKVECEKIKEVVVIIASAKEIEKKEYEKIEKILKSEISENLGIKIDNRVVIQNMNDKVDILINCNIEK